MNVPWLETIAPSDVRPYHVQLELTWRCNWRCVHCYQDDHAADGLTLPELERLFDELRTAGTLHLIVTGGEPLVRRDLLDVLAGARTRGLALTLYTNAHAVTAEIAERLARLIAVAEVSILAGDDAIHDALCRVPGAAGRAWAGIEHLARSGIDVVVKTPLLAPAIGTHAMLEARVRALGLEWIPDPELSQSYAGADFPLTYAPSPAQLAELYRELPRYRPGRRTVDPGAPRGICLAGRQHAFVDAHGDVYPCLSFKAPADARVRRGDARTARLGNVRDSAFGEIWAANPVLAEIRAAQRATFRTCATCTGACDPCMAASYEEHGDLFGPSRARCHERDARRLPVLRA